jgi:hypothetical protein
MKRRAFMALRGGAAASGREEGAQQNAMSVIGLIGGATCTGA